MNLIRLLLIATISIAIAACDQKADVSHHKLDFPASAKNFQNRGDSHRAIPDRGIATLVEINRKDLDAFEKQLKITERHQPAHTNPLPRLAVSYTHLTLPMIYSV